jgi:proline iminopeptidase
MKPGYLFVFFILLITSCTNDRISEVMDTGYLEGAEGALIHYKVIGGNIDTLVVLHGGPGAGINSVLPDVKPLAKEFTLVLYDQRGGGLSELPDDTTKLRPEYFVEDLEAVRRHFGLGQMNLFTHSFGSVIAASYAVKYPERIRRAVFHGATGPELMQELNLRRLDPAPPADSLLAAQSSELLASLLSGTAENPVETCRQYERINRQIAEARGDRVTHNGTTCDAPPESVRYYYRYTAQLAPRYYGGWDFTDGKLQQVSAPHLIIWGGDDAYMIPAQQTWADAFPNGELLLVPDAGKPAITDNPGYVINRIEAFIK